MPCKADDRLADHVVGLLIALLAVLRETEQRLLGGIVDAPLIKDMGPATVDRFWRETPPISLPRPCSDDRTAA